MKILLYAIALCCLACQGAGETPAPTPSERGDLPDQESWDARLILSEAGATRAIVQAGRVWIFQKQGITQIDEGVRIDFYNRDGSHSSTLTAERGFMDDNKKDIRAIGRVLILSDEGDTLQTEEIRWDRAKEKIYADGPVRMATQDGVEEGVGFESESNLKRWKMRQVRGTMRRMNPDR